MRVGFMGTPDFALHALKAIDASAHDVVCVYSQPPRPKGRGHKLQPSPVHAYALEKNIPVYHPENLKTLEAQEEFASHGLDIAVVAAYGLLLPKAVLDAPRYGCINIHASLLPRWRGASPIHRAVWAGDEMSGISIMQMDEGLDTGPVIAMEGVNLGADETTISLHDKLAVLGAKMCVQTLNNLAENGQVTVKEQENEGVTYAHLLKKDDGKLDWQHTADEISRQIRALVPWPGVWTMAEGQRFKILESKQGDASQAPQNIKDRPAGIVLNPDGDVLCGQESVLRITKIQPPGKQAMDFKSSVNGGYIKPGMVFGL